MTAEVVDLRRYCTAQEIGDFLSLHKETVLRLARQNRIPHVRVSKTVVRFDRDAVERYLVENGWPAGIP